MNKELIDIELNKVVIKSPVREECGDLTTLEKSISQIGLLYPIIIDKNNVLIAGRRRLEACKNIGYTKASAFKLDIEASSMSGLEIQSDANLCRLPLTKDEIEKQIELKKQSMAGKPPDSGAGIISKLKKLFLGA